MDEPIHKISKDFEVTHYPSFMDELTNLIRNFQTPYEEAINIMLQELLARVNDKIHSENDKQILYTRILNLLQKLILQLSGQSDTNVIEKLDSLISRHLKHVERSSFSADRHINVDLANDLITIIQKLFIITIEAHRVNQAARA